MCGIVGYYAFIPHHSINTKLERWFTQALHVNTLRGVDGTGCAKIGQHSGEVEEIAKLPVAFPYFAQSGSLTNILKGTSPKGMIGHNRKATIGGVSYHSTHPFQHGAITLVHNGTLHGLYDKEKWPEGDGDTDSEKVALALSKAKDPLNILKELKGSYSLVWYDNNKKNLYMVRNGDRPLYLTLSKDHDILWFGSESWMLEGVAARLDFEIEETRILREHHLVWFNHEDGKLKDFDTLNHQDYKPKVDTVARHNNYTGEYDNEWFSHLGYQHRYRNRQAEKGNSVKDFNQRKFNESKILQRLGLKKGDQVPLRLVGYNPYKGNEQNGTVLLCAILPEKLPCQGKAFKQKVEVYTKNHAKMGYGKVRGIIQGFKDEDFYLNVEDLKFPTKIKELEELMDQCLKKKESENIPLLPHQAAYIKGPNGVFIPKKMFLEKVGGGCVDCNRELTEEDAEELYWISDEEPLCKACIPSWMPTTREEDEEQTKTANKPKPKQNNRKRQVS